MFVFTDSLWLQAVHEVIAGLEKAGLPLMEVKEKARLGVHRLQESVRRFYVAPLFYHRDL